MEQARTSSSGKPAGFQVSLFYLRNTAPRATISKVDFTESVEGKLRRFSIFSSLFLSCSFLVAPTPSDAQNLLQNLKRELGNVAKPKTKAPKVKNNDAGKVIGGIVGGIVGNEVSDGDALGIIVGATIGAVIGNEIANNTNEEQKTKVAGATTKAVVSGESETWVDPETQKTNSVTVVETTRLDSPVTVPVDKSKVAVVPPIDLIGEVYTVSKTSNVRGGPGTNYGKVGRLVAGTQVNVVGKVKDEPWLMTSNNGVASGYVYEPLLSQTSRPIIQKKAPASVAPSDQTELVVVAASQECRTIEQVIGDSEGVEHRQTIEACKGAEGWAISERQSDNGSPTGLVEVASKPNSVTEVNNTEASVRAAGSGECRTIEQPFLAENGGFTSRVVTACHGSRGWEIQGS